MDGDAKIMDVHPCIGPCFSGPKLIHSVLPWYLLLQMSHDLRGWLDDGHGIAHLVDVHLARQVLLCAPTSLDTGGRQK